MDTSTRKILPDVTQMHISFQKFRNMTVGVGYTAQLSCTQLFETQSVWTKIEHVRHLIEPGIQPVLVYRLVLRKFIYKSGPLNVYLQLIFSRVNCSLHHMYIPWGCHVIFLKFKNFKEVAKKYQLNK